MSSLLARSRAAFGPAPRSIPAHDVVEPPPWMKADDLLRAAYRDRTALFETGDIVWGHVVQANSQLLRRGDVALPAHVLYASLPEGEPDPERLERAADRTFALKGRTPADPELARVAGALADDAPRHPPFDLPVAIHEGMPMRLAIVVVHPRLLPRPYLASFLVPLLASRARDSVVVLPVRHWASDLVDGWLALGARPR